MIPPVPGDWQHLVLVDNYQQYGCKVVHLGLYLHQWGNNSQPTVSQQSRGDAKLMLSRDFQLEDVF